MNDGKLQWHAAFGAALRIDLGDELKKVQIEEEHLLGKKPMQVDFLVLKLCKDQKIYKNIGRLFKTHNIVEYKSPDDYLSINDFYKVYGYACFYQADTQKTGEIPPEEISITFVCNRYPEKMLKHVERVRGIRVERKESGIYELIGDPITMQLIITHELTKEKNFWIQNLRNDLQTGGEIQDIIDTYEKNKGQALYQAVMNVIIRANQERIREARQMQMCEALDELFYDIYADDLENRRKEGRREGRNEGIAALVGAAWDWKMPKQEVLQKIMEKFQLSEQDAESYVAAYYK